MDSNQAVGAVFGRDQRDPDQDGLSNFWEFLFGSRPDLASDAPGLSLTIQRADVDGQADDYLFLTFRRNLLANASLTVEVSRNLIHWTADPAMIKPVAEADNEDGTATVTHRFDRPVGQGQHRAFFRLRGQ